MRSLQYRWRELRSSSLARNASWMFLGQGVSMLCLGAYFILLARLLGPIEYGIYAGVFAMVSILSAYSALGSHFTLLRHVSPDPEKFALYWGNVLVTTLSLGTVSPGSWFGLCLVWPTRIRGGWCSALLSAIVSARSYRCLFPCLSSIRRVADHRLPEAADEFAARGAGRLHAVAPAPCYGPAMGWRRLWRYLSRLPVRPGPGH